MPDIKNILLKNKKILFFVLGFAVVIGIGSWFVFSSPDETVVVDDEEVAGTLSGDEQKTSEAEQLAEDIKSKLGFFSQKGVIDFFEKHDDLIPITVSLSELAVENPFQAFPKSEGEYLSIEEPSGEEIISQPEE
jgi:hypothetical protein